MSEKSRDVKRITITVPKMPESSAHLDDNIDYSDIEAKCDTTFHIFAAESDLTFRYQVHYDEGFDHVVVVDGVPIIDKSKLDRLLTKVSKEFSRKGVPIKLDNVFMPWDEETGKNKG